MQAPYQAVVVIACHGLCVVCGGCPM